MRAHVGEGARFSGTVVNIWQTTGYHIPEESYLRLFSLVSIVNQMSLVHIYPVSSSLHSDIRLFLPSEVFPLNFPTKLVHVFLIPPVLAMCPTHHILFDLRNLKLFG